MTSNLHRFHSEVVLGLESAYRDMFAAYHRANARVPFDTDLERSSYYVIGIESLKEACLALGFTLMPIGDEMTTAPAEGIAP